MTHNHKAGFGIKDMSVSLYVFCHSSLIHIVKCDFIMWDQQHLSPKRRKTGWAVSVLSQFPVVTRLVKVMDSIGPLQLGFASAFVQLIPWCTECVDRRIILSLQITVEIEKSIWILMYLIRSTQCLVLLWLSPLGCLHSSQLPSETLSSRYLDSAVSLSGSQCNDFFFHPEHESHSPFYSVWKTSFHQA